MNMKKKITPKKKEMIAEALDIVQNTESDEVAIGFLRETIEDDYPDMDLGSMNLHEAIKVLGHNKDDKSKGLKAIEDLSSSIGAFIDSQKKAQKPVKKKRKSRRKRK